MDATSFYQLAKEERAALVHQMHQTILLELAEDRRIHIPKFFSDPDTYIRKNAYLAVGRIFFDRSNLQLPILKMLDEMMSEDHYHIRQTAINAAGQIGKKEFDKIVHLMDNGLFDTHHTVRNAVIGSIKKMGEVNPRPVIKWANKYLHHPDKEIRREICHGIELRGRTHPEDILPLLKDLQFDKTARVRKTLVHVMGQIAYKKGCLEKVMKTITEWENKILVNEAIEEIIDVHHRYRNFSYYSQDEARSYISSLHPGL